MRATQWVAPTGVGDGGGGCGGAAVRGWVSPNCFSGWGRSGGWVSPSYVGVLGVGDGAGVGGDARGEVIEDSK